MLNSLKDTAALNGLAERYRVAFDKTQCGRAMWIEGTLELAGVVREARERPELASPISFGRWLKESGLRVISNQDISALHMFGENLAYARELLEQSTSISWQQVWRTRPNKSPRALSGFRKGTERVVRGHLSGSAARKRAKRIPDVMRDDYEPAPRQSVTAKPVPFERPAPNIRALTREQVDPDFKGTALEFATKYGHVNLHTKQELEYHKQQEVLSAWLSAVNDFYNSACSMVAQLNMLDTATLQEWKAKPGKAAKLQAWRDRCELACKKLENI